MHLSAACICLNVGLCGKCRSSRCIYLDENPQQRHFHNAFWSCLSQTVFKDQSKKVTRPLENLKQNFRTASVIPMLFSQTIQSSCELKAFECIPKHTSSVEMRRKTLNEVFESYGHDSANRACGHFLHIDRGILFADLIVA